MAMSELSHRFGPLPSRHATPLQRLNGIEETFTVKSTPRVSSTYSGCASLDSKPGALPEKILQTWICSSGPGHIRHPLETLRGYQKRRRRPDRFDPASLCYSLVENGSAAILDLRLPRMRWPDAEFLILCS